MRILKSILVILSFILPLAITASEDVQLHHGETNKNRHVPWPPYSNNLQTGIAWPDGQALPQFALPVEMLDGLDITEQSMPITEKVMFAALQGLVNKQRPRIFLYDAAREGKNKWPDLLQLNITELPYEQRWKLIRKYQDEIAGTIIYDIKKSIHYINLASTISGLKHGLPVTESEYNQLVSQGIRLPIIFDLRELDYSSPSEIYTFLYNSYWKDCTKRLFVSLSPYVAACTRDIGIASGTAIVWLDPRKEDENAVLRLFLKDMEAGKSIMIGWWAEERSGIGIGTEYGISTIPADFYQNATVYAGMPHNIQMPEVPKKPLLENKIYLAIFLSDGDNVQYCQHAMSELWDNKSRGIIPINWTVSPGLVDIGPGLLNYYYATATPNDFFASGPSGLGYALIYDAHNKKWNMTEQQHINAYTQFTQQYLEKSGLRVITIWDEVNDTQMNSYASHCRYLYGITLEDWERHDSLKPVSKQDKLVFMPNFPCYASKIDDIYKRWEKQIIAFDGSEPLFLAAQGESWKMSPENIVELKNRLEKLAPGKITVCRGDHFFTLYNEAHNLDFNLTLSPEMKISSSGTTTNDAYAANGTSSGNNKWISTDSKEKWLLFDFGKKYSINRYVIRHAGADGTDPRFNTRSFKLEVSNDSINWVTADHCKNNADSVTDIDIPSTDVRFVRITILDCGKDNIARIGDVEIYGKVIN